MSEVTWMERDVNPITKLDYPDVDVIRVENTYYMVSTTMHFMPGCEILRSYDLIHWEHATYVYDRLDGTSGQRLEENENIYGKGMWAASLRCHKGIFYVCFVANVQARLICFSRRISMDHGRNRQLKGFIMIVHCYLMTMTECILHPGIRIFV